MQITRRNTERFHQFADAVAKACGIHDLQGLLMNDNWKPTAAVEAFELSEPLGDRPCVGTVIQPGELYIKCAFAEQVGVPLYLLTHIRGQGGVAIYEFQADHRQKAPVCVSKAEKSEAGFVSWWRERKQTVQTKAYRSDLSRRIANSWFDRVLESQGEKWGGNVDGFLVGCASGDVVIRGIVENRFTNKTPLNAYDPNRYFNYGGGDYYTWLPLFNLHVQMGIPLFLATYSNRAGETNSAGLAIVDALSQDGIAYSRQIRPCQNILSSVDGIGAWFQDHT